MMVSIERSLRELAGSVPEGHLLADASVRDIVYDSRQVTSGALFCCVPGENVDGHVFARAAVTAGASALLVEHELDLDVPQLVVPSVRAAMGPIADRFFGHPSGSLELAGVTGTNGKTTITYLLAAVTAARGGVPGIMGTIETRIGDLSEPVTHTTPESIDVHRTLARMVDSDVTTVGMEVSSHGLDMGRVDGCSFAVGIFTNLTQDHLDYHRTMEDYFEAKALLFDPDRTGHAVINIDDPWGRLLAERAQGRIPLTTFSIEQEADVAATAMRIAPDSSVADVRIGGDTFEMQVPLSARYNVSNALAVLSAGEALGWDRDQVLSGIARMPGVPGRLERIDRGQDFTVLVDYAHTPDSLRNVLTAARELVPSGAKLWVVFGCGGDRDRGKRPLMGAAGAELADRCIITSDNPRSETPEDIVHEIARGARETGRSFETIVDRREAIAAAIHGASAGDVIVVAGKGHETGQKFAESTIPFDDRLVCAEILEELS